MAQVSHLPLYTHLSNADSSLNAQQLLRLTHPKEWITYPTADFHFGYSRDYHWLKLHLPTNTLPAATYFWVLDAPTVQNARLYCIQNDSIVAAVEAGTDFPFAHRLVNHRHLLLPFTVRADRPTTLLLRIHNDIGTVVGSLAVHPQSQFEYYDVRVRMVWVLLIALFSLASVIATGFHLALRERLYAHYAFYILSALGFVLTFSGLGYQFVWYNFPRFAFACKAFWMLTEAIFLMLFVYRLFYAHRNERPKLHRAIYALSLVMLFFIALLLLPIPLHNARWLTPFANASILAAIGVVLKIIYDNIKLRQPAAYYFLLSFAPVLGGALLMLLRNLNIYTNDWLMSPFLMPSLHCIEIFLLFIALLKRFQTDRNNAIKLQTDLQNMHLTANEQQQKLLAELAVLQANATSISTEILLDNNDNNNDTQKTTTITDETNRISPAWQLSEERQLRILVAVYDSINTQKIYLDTDLSLSLFAQQLQVSPTYLSQVINQREGLSFNDFINKHRIIAAKVMLADPNNTYSRLLAKVSFRLKRPPFGLQMRQIYRTMRCIELKI